MVSVPESHDESGEGGREGGGEGGREGRVDHIVCYTGSQKWSVDCVRKGTAK